MSKAFHYLWVSLAWTGCVRAQRKYEVKTSKDFVQELTNRRQTLSPEVPDTVTFILDRKYT